MILISGRVSLLKSIHKIMNIFLRAYGAKQTLFNHGLATWSTNIYVHVNRGLVIASADLAQRRSSRGRSIELRRDVRRCCADSRRRRSHPAWDSESQPIGGYTDT